MWTAACQLRPVLLYNHPAKHVLVVKVRVETTDDQVAPWVIECEKDVKGNRSTSSTRRVGIE